jgi:putative inorganic carbon (HCO3(-)) transporter
MIIKSSYKIIKNVIRSPVIPFSVLTGILYIIPNSLWYDSFIYYASALVLFLFLLSFILNKNAIKSLDTIEPLYYLFLICILYGVFISTFKAESFKQLLFFMSCSIFICFIINLAGTLDSLLKFMDILLVFLFVTGLYGLYQAFILKVPPSASLTDINLNPDLPGRVFSTMGNPNYYAELILLFIPFYVYALFNAKTIKKKIYYIILFIPVLISFILTSGRAAILISFLSISFMLLTYNYRYFIRFVIAAFITFLLLPKWFTQRLISSFNFQDTSIQYRLEIYNAIKPFLSDYWIKGTGIGNKPFTSIMALYSSSLKTTPMHVHNTYIQILLETGLAGFIIFILLMFSVIKKCIKKIKNSSGRLRFFACACLASFISILLMGFVEHIWSYQRIMLAFWIIYAIILSISKIKSPCSK